MKRFQIHLDALVVIVLLFALSLGANLYLWRENSELFKEKVEVMWQAQNMESSWRYTKGLLDQCRESMAKASLAESQ